DGVGRFGLKEMMKCPIGTPVTTKFTLNNGAGRGGRSYYFQFWVPVDENRFVLRLFPGYGKIRPGKSVEITVELTMLITTRVERTIKLQVQSTGVGHRGSSPPPGPYFIPITLDGEISTKLDPEEIETELPPLGRGGFGTVYRGTYRKAQVAVKILNR